MKKIIFITTLICITALHAGIDQQLVDGINQKNLDMVQQALNRGIEINATDAQGKTALLVALQANNIPAAKLLLEKGASANVTDNAGMTTLMYAAKTGDLDFVKTILAKNPYIEAKDNAGKTALMHALEAKHIPVAQLLIQNNASIDSASNNGVTVLMYALPTKNYEFIRSLMNKVANINAQNNQGFTALHDAVAQNDEEIVKMLLSKGADANIRTNQTRYRPRNVEEAGNKTPLMFSKNSKITNLLLQHNANVNEIDSVGITVLMFAAKSGNPEIVKMILEKNPSINAKSKLQKEGNDTALYYAAKFGNNTEVVKLLLQAGANPLLKTKEGARYGYEEVTPAQVASTQEIKKILQEAEAKIKEQQVAQQMEKVKKDVKEKIQAAKEKK